MPLSRNTTFVEKFRLLCLPFKRVNCRDYVGSNFRKYVEGPASLNTERFAPRMPLNMQGNAALSKNLISFAGGGNENLFVNKVQAYLLLYSAQYFSKGKPSLSYSHHFSFRQQGVGFYPYLVLQKKKDSAPPKFGMRKRNGCNTSRNLIRVTTKNSSDCTRNARCIKATNVKYEYYAGGARKSYLSSQGA